MEAPMNSRACTLFPAEYEYLIAALRRDIASERDKAEVQPEWSGYHLQNVRFSVRLLEAFGYREDGLNRPDGQGLSD